MPPLDLVVLTSGAKGIALASSLATLAEVRSLAVVTTRGSPARQGPLTKLRRIHRHDGVPGLVRSALGRAGHPWRPSAGKDPAGLVARVCPGARHLHCDDLHAPESIALLRSLAPDLGIVFATYRLRPEVFSIPRHGCLNLHLGRAPEFRGSSPGFYEMLEGVPEVGVTVHRVIEGLDAGPILAQETFPLDIAPSEDPISYLERYQFEILVPNGTRMMAAEVTRIARGITEERSQGSGPPPRRRATYEQKRELRRRVARRRSTLAGTHPGAPSSVRN